MNSLAKRITLSTGLGLLLLTTGCFDTKEDFTINPDGSGKVVHECTFQAVNLNMGNENEDPGKALTNAVREVLEKATGIEKEIDITLDPTGSHVVVVHKLTNRGQFAIEMSCWAMSVMNKGGTAILPQEPYQSHDEALLPARPLVLWPYTNLTDPRWSIGQKYITLRHDPDMKESQKVGILNRQGWAAYYRNSLLFFKRFPCEAEKTYPDFNSNNETYTDAAILELETLGALEKVQPGGTISHREDWWLYKSVDIGNGEAGIAAALQPVLTDTAKKQ